MKIKIIAPARKTEWAENFWDFNTLSKLTGYKAGGAPLVLPTLAALTPSDVEVVLSDENVEPINFEEKVDLAAITGITCFIPRSYEIADEYRRRGVPVVMGGIHVSMLPREAIAHCDSVVIGEAEGIWEQVVRDAQKKNLQKFYDSPKFPELTNTPVPRWELLKNDKYWFFTIQTGRGCPYDCAFCSVKEFNGREYRHKTIENVIRQVRALQSIDPKKQIFFIDDNLLAMPGYTQDLMKELIPLKIQSWWCQSSVNRLNDDNVLNLMYKAGCRIAFIGFESVFQETLDSMNKSRVNKVNEYRETVNKIHSHGISVFGSFVLGGDNDDETVFEKTAVFIDETNIAFSMINIITPLIGTNFYKKLKDENRITENNWEKYNFETVCFIPNKIPAKILQEKYNLVQKTIYSYELIFKRLHNLWKNKILTSPKFIFSDLFTKYRIKFLWNCFFRGEKGSKIFILKSLCKKNGLLGAGSILLGISFHNYAYNPRK